MDPAQRAERRLPQRPRGGVHVAVHAGLSTLISAQRRGQEPHHVGADQQPDGPRHQQPGRDVEPRPHEGVERVVEGREGHQQADRDHAPRHRIAQSRHRPRDIRQPPGAHPLEVSHRHRGDQRQPRGAGGERERVAHETHVAAAGQVLVRPQPHLEQDRRGQEAAQQHRQTAEDDCTRRACAAQPGGRHRDLALAGIVIARGTALRALQHGDQQREGQKAQGQLRRRGAVGHQEPAGIDAGRQRLHPEMGDGAEIGDRLHDRQQDAPRDGGPRHGEADLPEGREGPAPQRARGQEPGRALLQEGGAGQQVDVRVKHQRQHDRRAAQRPDFREPVVTRPPAGQVAQGGLHDPRMVQHMGIGIGQHVGRKGQRQDQHDLEDPRTRKARHRHQPGRADAQDQSARRHQRDQRQRRPGIARQHRLHQVRDGVGAPGQCRQRDRQHGQKAGRRDQADHHAQRPRAAAAPVSGPGGGCLRRVCQGALLVPAKAEDQLS